MTSPKGIHVRYRNNSGGPAEFEAVPGSGSMWLSCGTSDIFAGAAAATAGILTAWFDASLHTAMSATISEKTKSPEQIAFEKGKERLIGAVNRMRSSSPNWRGAQTRVSEESAQSAKKFLDCLPGNAILPRVAPDGEGDIMFVWDAPGHPNCVVTVEKHSLHLASGLGTPEAMHVDDKRFLGVQIPRSILKHIPLR